jgi:hypothetical protein
MYDFAISAIWPIQHPPAPVVAARTALIAESPIAFATPKK